MKHWVTIKYIKCRADLNFEVDFRVNSAIGMIAIKCDLILFGKRMYNESKLTKIAQIKYL